MRKVVIGTMPVSDKQALIEMAAHMADKLRKDGKSDDEIEGVLKTYHLSDGFNRANSVLI